MHAGPLTPCPGCGEPLPELDGATHPYVGASSACWTRFAEVNATLPPATPLRRLVTDAYMVQHPGVAERRAIQSVGLHLVGLCLVLDHGFPPDRLSEALQRVLAKPPAWRWLEPPVPNGLLTIGSLEVAAGSGRPDEISRAIGAYVRDVWSAWRVHHATVEGWAADAGLADATPGAPVRIAAKPDRGCPRSALPSGDGRDDPARSSPGRVPASDGRARRRSAPDRRRSGP